MAIRWCINLAVIHSFTASVPPFISRKQASSHTSYRTRPADRRVVPRRALRPVSLTDRKRVLHELSVVVTAWCSVVWAWLTLFLYLSGGPRFVKVARYFFHLAESRKGHGMSAVNAGFLAP
ncbi:hypothetical protein J6590_033735 [Homalodisca vitripennis]|nr:hypothetical protein J6590_033735 [Homalodisca vitripennis]